KPISTRSAYAASAAFGIAANGGKIQAQTRVSEFGSIGVVQAFLVDEHVVEVTSTDAPKKRPDVTTDEGKAVVREELDPLHEEFVAAIARGRTRAGRETKPEEINASWGRGGMIIAEEAKRLGMIDKAPPRGTSSLRRAENSEARTEVPPQSPASADGGGPEV